MRVTVAICTWNRSNLLRQMLEQLTRASVPVGMELEVMVVNNNCTDGTDAVIAEFLGRLPLKRVFESQPGLSHARNTALSVAAGDYVLFTDDDVLVDEAWLVEFEAATRAFPDAVAIGGIIDPWFPQTPDPELVGAFSVLAIGFCGLDHHREPGPLSDLPIYGANMAYRVSAIRCLGFNVSMGVTPTSTMGGEELELIRRLRAVGGSVIWWPNMKVRHHVDPSRMTPAYLIRYLVGWGAMRVLLEPGPSARLVFGAPPWLWRQYATAWLAYLIAHVTKAEVIRLYPKCPVDARASRRVRTLSWRREVAILGGMIRGYRQLERQRASRGSEAPSPAARLV